MELAEGIRTIGFRRWYERQLVESHLFLITGFLCLIAALACFEGFSLRPLTWGTAVRLSVIAASTTFSLWTLRRYLEILGLAEYAAERSVCENCATYRGLDVTSINVRRAWEHHEHGEGALPPVGVRCRKCGHEWTIE